MELFGVNIITLRNKLLIISSILSSHVEQWAKKKKNDTWNDSYKYVHLKIHWLGFPDDPVVESTLKCRGHWFSPWSRKIPRAADSYACVAQLLRPCSRAGGPQPLSPCAVTAETSLCSATRQATAMRSWCTATSEWSLLSKARDNSCTATETQHSQK